MSRPSSHDRAYAAYLNDLEANEHRAALAALRRGVGPGTRADAYPYVFPWIPPGATRWQETAYALVGALFATHRATWVHHDEGQRSTNLGASLAWLARETESQSIERRFVALLNAAQEDVPQHLRHAVSLLKAHEIPVDWAQLLRDVQDWNEETGNVRRDWARAYWGATAAVIGTAADAEHG